MNVSGRPSGPSSKTLEELNLVRAMYLLRTLGMAFGIFCTGAALYQQNASIWTYPFVLLCGFGWPHLAYFWALRSANPLAAEHRNLWLDAAMRGVWLPLIGFSLAPTVLMIAILGLNNTLVGGGRLLARSVTALIFAAGLATVLFGFHPNLFSNQMTRIACAPFLAIYPAILGILIGTYRNRTARDEARAHQQVAELRLTNLLAASPTVLYALEYDGETWWGVEITANLPRLIGYTTQEVLEHGWWDSHVHPDDYEAAKQAISRVMMGERVVCHYRIAHKSGGYRWLRDELALHPASGDQPARIIGAWLDITEKEQAQADIRRLAFFDTLTGLANRQMLHEHLAKSFSEARQSGDLGGLLLIDLDGFKRINDIHGHAIGDQMLMETAQRLLGCLRASDTVARVGGDEFAILLPKLGHEQEKATARAVILAKKLSAAIDRTMTVAGLQLHVTASIGISIFPYPSGTIEDILREADIAMYAAKATTKDRAWSGDNPNIAVFEVTMQNTVTQRHRIETEIQSALADQRFELWLQRQVDVEGNIIGAEALIRLRDTDGRLLPPNDFIPIAEESGLIIPIGQWVRTEACLLLTNMDAARLPRLSINVSAIEFRQPRFAEEILNALKQARVDASRLVLEITESLLIDRLDDTVAKLERLTDQGIRISIDDFGTGYSSLAYLQRLPISEIKIDRQFVNEMLANTRSSRLTQSLIMLAGNMGFEVIAEGVETKEQKAFLIQHGCQRMQGFLFGKPEPAANYASREILKG